MKSLWMILFVGLSSPTYANETTMLGRGDPLRLVYAEIQYLYQVGLQINQEFPNPTDPQQMRYCKGQYGYILSRARALIGTAGQIDDPELRDQAVDAGWYAYACASCETPAQRCDALPEQIELLEQAIRARDVSAAASKN